VLGENGSEKFERDWIELKLVDSGVFKERLLLRDTFCRRIEEYSKGENKINYWNNMRCSEFKKEEIKNSEEYSTDSEYFEIDDETNEPMITPVPFPRSSTHTGSLHGQEL